MPKGYGRRRASAAIVRQGVWECAALTSGVLFMAFNLFRVAPSAVGAGRDLAG
jgi:hypothetical protein